MTETVYNRRPIQLIELTQPRCALRFGTLPCAGGMGPQALSSMDVDFRKVGLSSQWATDQATLSLAPAGAGVRVSATGADPKFWIPGNAAQPFSGSSQSYVTVLGIWRSGLIDLTEARMWWYNSDGHQPNGGEAAQGQIFSPDGTPLGSGPLLTDQPFVMRFRAFDSTVFASQWRGKTITGLRIDFNQTTDTIVDVQRIYITAGVWPVSAALPRCYNTRTTCSAPPSYDPSSSLTWRFTTPDNEGAFRGLGIVGNEFLDNDYAQGATTRSAQIELTAGETYDLELRYWETVSASTLSATVTPPSGGAVSLATAVNGSWDYTAYNFTASSGRSQAFRIEKFGTVAGSGSTTGFDVQALINSARGIADPDPNYFGLIFTATFTAAENGVYTFATTSDDGSTLQVFNASGSLIPFLGDNVATPAIPALVGTGTKPTRLNLGAARDGESPFGVRSELDATFQDIPWGDPWADNYRDIRANPNRGTFWAKFKARNEFLSGMTVRLYEGYAGQQLREMQSRLFLPDRIDGPDADGKVRMRAADPLQLADRRRSLFPRPTPIILETGMTASTTTIRVFASAADVNDAFGNTSARYIRAGDEIISYGTVTLLNGDSGLYQLTGVVRGTLGTQASEHAVNETLQRVGRYENLQFWLVLYDLLTNHTPAGLDPSYIDLSQWNAEGEKYLGIFRATGTVPAPTPVTDLAGELSQQGLFSVWWDERRQTIPLLAVRPPEAEPIPVDDLRNILPGAEVKDAPEERLTRVLLYYDQRVPTRDIADPGNYARGQYRGEPALEAPETGGEVRTKTIFSRWVREDALAIQLTRRLVSRYLKTPRYLTIRLDAKDRAITVGTVLSVNTRTITDSEGRVRPVLWQVISENEIVPGETVIYDCQTFSFTGRFAVYMANGSPTYAVAAAASSDPETMPGGWYAGPDGRLSDGTEGYQYQ